MQRQGQGLECCGHNHQRVEEAKKDSPLEPLEEARVV